LRPLRLSEQQYEQDHDEKQYEKATADVHEPSLLSVGFVQTLDHLALGAALGEAAALEL